MRRRSLLRLVLGLAALSARGRAAFGALIGPSGQAVYPLTALAPYLDTLIPADGRTGSAGDLGVTERLRDKMRLESGYVRLARRGCRWLDDAARRRGAGDFAALDAAGREAIVVLAAAARKRSLPRVFFERTRGDAMAAYYAEPAVWADIGYDGPPQPRGFPDHARAPR